MEKLLLLKSAETIRRKINELIEKAGDGTPELDLAKRIARELLPLADEFEREAGEKK